MSELREFVRLREQGHNGQTGVSETNMQDKQKMKQKPERIPKATAPKEKI